MRSLFGTQPEESSQEPKPEQAQKTATGGGESC